MPRRFWSFAAILCALLPMVFAGSHANAQPSGHTLTLNVWTCSMSGGLPSLTIAEVANPSGVGRDCVEGAVGASTIRVNDVFGTVDGANVTWEGISGDVTIAASVAAVDGAQITVDQDTTLYATFYVSDIKPATLTLNVWTCNVTGGLPSLTIAEHANESGVGRNCVEGSAGIDSITVDGVVGTVTGNQVIWNGLSGDAVISAPVAAVDGGNRTIASDTTLYATFYVSDLTPEAALPTGHGTVRIAVQECLVATGVQSFIGSESDAPSGMDNCYSGRIDAKEWGLRVDGNRPDSYANDIAIWTNLPNGTHVATTETGARYEFTIQDESVMLAAWFGPNGTTSFGGAAAPTTQTPVGAAAVTALPKTGAGSETSGVPVMLIGASLLTVLTVASAFAVRTQRIRRS